MRVQNPNSTVLDCGFCSVTGEHFERPDRPLSGQKQPAAARDPRAWQCQYFSTSTSWLKATCSQATCARSRSSPRTTSVDPGARHPGSRGRQRVRHLQAQSTRKVPLMLARVLAPGPRPLPARPVNRHQVHGLVPPQGCPPIAVHPRSLDQYSLGRFLAETLNGLIRCTPVR